MIKNDPLDAALTGTDVVGLPSAKEVCFRLAVTPGQDHRTAVRPGLRHHSRRTGEPHTAGPHANRERSGDGGRPEPHPDADDVACDTTPTFKPG